MGLICCLSILAIIPLKRKLIHHRSSNVYVSWHREGFQTFNIWHLCCTLKRCWVKLIPAEHSQLVVEHPLLFPGDCRPAYSGCVHIRIEAPTATCNQRTHYLRQVCCARVRGVLLSLIHSHWFLCAVHTEQWLNCILSCSQPPLHMSSMVVKGVFTLLGLCRG